MQHLDLRVWTKIYPESLENKPAPYWFAQKLLNVEHMAKRMQHCCSHLTTKEMLDDVEGDV